jgi:hypothetical protein
MSEHEIQPPEQPQFKFPLQEILAARERGEKFSLIEFDYAGESFQVEVYDFALNEPFSFGIKELDEDLPLSSSTDIEQIYDITMYVNDQHNNELAKISGQVYYDGRDIVLHSAKNFTFDEVESEAKALTRPRVKKLMVETIYQLLIQKIFATIYGSTILTPGGEKLFQNIFEDKQADLEAILQGNSSFDGQKRWRLRLRS